MLIKNISFSQWKSMEISWSEQSSCSPLECDVDWNNFKSLFCRRKIKYGNHQQSNDNDKVNQESELTNSTFGKYMDKQMIIFLGSATLKPLALYCIDPSLGTKVALICQDSTCWDVLFEESCTFAMIKYFQLLGYYLATSAQNCTVYELFLFYWFPQLLSPQWTLGIN